MRQDKLTSKFQMALADAQSSALGRDHQFIEPAHLMLALLDQEGGTVRPLLEKSGAKVSLLAYPFFTPSAERLRCGNVRVLAPRDIAVMKVIAISQRASVAAGRSSTNEGRICAMVLNLSRVPWIRQT